MKLIIQSKSSSINLGNKRIKKKENKIVILCGLWSSFLSVLYLDHICKKKEKTRRVTYDT
jgi:hypothetical protein